MIETDWATSIQGIVPVGIKCKMQPIYRIKPSHSRFILVELSKLVALGSLLYFSAYLNLYLLGIEMQIQHHLILAAAVLILLAVEIVLGTKKENSTFYDFYQDRIMMYTPKMAKKIMYAEISGPRIQKNIFDLIAKSGTIVLSKDFKIKGIDNFEEVMEYVARNVGYNLY